MEFRLPSRKHQQTHRPRYDECQNARRRIWLRVSVCWNDRTPETVQSRKLCSRSVPGRGLSISLECPPPWTSAAAFERLTCTLPQHVSVSAPAGVDDALLCNPVAVLRHVLETPKGHRQVEPSCAWTMCAPQHSRHAVSSYAPSETDFSFFSNFQFWDLETTFFLLSWRSNTRRLVLETDEYEDVNQNLMSL